MTLPFDAITLFAEDVREEVQGTMSLIGVVPDTLAVAGVPSLLPKLAIYTRIHVPIDVEITELAVVAQMLDGVEIAVGDFPADFLAKARDEAVAEGKEFYGLVGHALATPFPVQQLGSVRVIVRHDGVEHLSGSLNFKLAD